MNFKTLRSRMARGLRLAIIRQQYAMGNLTKAEAIEILSGPLTPGDNTTIIDDSHLLEATIDDIIAAGLLDGDAWKRIMQ